VEAPEAFTPISSIPARRGDRLAGVLFLPLTVLLVYLAGGFILDDYFHIERASRPLRLEALRFAIHTEDHGIVLWPHAAPVHLDFLRPISSLTFWVEYRFWGLRAWGYHLDNILLHLLNLALLCRLARRLGLSTATTILLAVAWGVSLPAAPAVGWISGRTELLSALFVLSSVLSFDRWITGGRVVWFAAAGFLGGVAPFAKESGVVAPILMLIFSRLREGRVPGAARRRLLPWPGFCLFLPALAYLWLRFVVLRIPAPPVPYIETLRSSSDGLWLVAKPVLYLVTSFLSLPLSHVSPLSMFHEAPISLLALAAAALLLLRPLARAAGLGVAGLSLAWFAVGLSPYLPVIPTSLYLYLPLSGLMLLLGAARDERADCRWPTRWLAGLIAAGTAANAAVGVFTWSAATRLDQAAADAARICREQSAARLVLFDTPVWAYGLPAAVRLHDPGCRADTWFVNFSPSALPGRPSRLRWTEPLLLEVRPDRGRFFESPFEQFLLFGGSPADTTLQARSDFLTVRPDTLTGHPGVLRLRFRGAGALEKSQLLQFRGWRLARAPAAPPLHAARANERESSPRPGPLGNAGRAIAR